MKQQCKKERIVGKRMGSKLETPAIKKESVVSPTKYKNKLLHLPTIQDILSIPKESRSEKITEYFKTIKPFLGSYLVKKQGCRVMQLVYKWGSAEVKAEIYKAILQNWKDLIKSKEALHVISKVAVNAEFPNLANDAVTLQNSHEGSTVLQNWVIKHPHSELTRSIFAKFEKVALNGVEKGLDSLEVLHNLTMKCIQKNYYTNKLSKMIIRLSLPTMLDTEKQKALEFLIQNSSKLIDEEQGIRLFIDIYNYCDPKQKKNIMKQFISHIAQALSYSPVSYIAVIKILLDTDDTVFLNRKILPELLQILPEVENQKKLYNVLFSIFSERSNNFNCLGKYEHESSSCCKKPENLRVKEIRHCLYGPVVEFLTQRDNIEQTCRNPNRQKLAIGIVKSMLKDQCIKELQIFVLDLFKFFITNYKQTPIVKDSILADAVGSKLLKHLISIKQQFLQDHCEIIAQLLLSKLKDVMHCKATFVLGALVERGGRNYILDAIQKSGINMNKVHLEDFYNKKIYEINEKRGK